MALVVKVSGVLLTHQAFEDLPRVVRGRLMKIGLNAAGGVIRDTAVALAPKGSGLLRKSLKVKVSVPELSYNPLHRGRPAYAVVGPARRISGAVTTTARGSLKVLGSRNAIFNAAFKGKTITLRRPSRYSHLVERGTRAHVVGAKRASVLSDGRNVFGRRVSHPGSKAQSFLAAAVRSSGSAAQNKMLGKIYEGIIAWSNARASRIFSRLTV